MKDERRLTPAHPRGESTSRHAGTAKVEDAALIHRIAEQDEAALSELYDSWAQRVHAIALWILRDADEAEDVVEETFWQVWRTAHLYDGRRSPASTWLVMIARCRTLDRLRVRKRRANQAVAYSAVSALDREDGSTADEMAGTQPRGDDWPSGLAGALAALPAEQQKVVQMAFFAGLSQAEIARQIGIPLGTVKTRIRLALQKLRRRIVIDGEESP
ncbi:MAG: sigma-70 family RNA polymerase sigma factor [Gemmatimonadales bacterium]|nr:sigma-70 family RNA polymerase sigma factor [Gemmatimonadales bacterium]